MRDIDDFLPLVMPCAPNAPEPTVIRHLRDAAARFCERTRLWRCTDTIVTDGKDAEAISAPQDGIVFEVRACSLDGRPLDPISLDKLALDRPNWRKEDVGSGGGKWFASPRPGTVQAIPRSSGTLFVEVALKPTMTALTLPSFMLDLYGQDIADGAAAGVLMTPEADFAKPDYGAVLKAQFEATLARLADQGSRGQQRAPRRQRAKFF